jgi:hypothetical protein
MYLNEERQANVTKKRYESGHMIYLHEPSLAQIRRDLVMYLASLRGGSTAPSGNGAKPAAKKPAAKKVVKAR